MKELTLLELIGLDVSERDDLKLRCIAGRKGLGRKIVSHEVNRPGLALSGFFDDFAVERVQIFGNGEVAYLKALEKKSDFAAVKNFFTYKVPCCVVTAHENPPNFFLDLAEKAECAVLKSELGSADFTTRFIRLFSNLFAPRKISHSVFVSVFGVGTLILGDSGIGKSETALELIERGHMLIADDGVEIRCLNGNMLVGRAVNMAINQHMEIRGLGVINIARLYGISAICERCELQLVIRLLQWDKDKNYDRVGIDEKTENILGIDVPCVDVPVRPGRNVPVIIETAAKEQRLKSMGYFSARDFNKNVLKWIETDNAKKAYYGYEGIY